MRALPGLTIRNNGGSSPVFRALMLAFAMVCALTAPVGPVFAQEKAEASQAPAVYRPRLNFTGDTKTDFALVDIITGTPIHWRVLRNPAPAGPGEAFIRYFDFGNQGDTLASFDYNGDGFNEAGIWRSGIHYAAPFPESGAPFGPLTYTYWGNPTGENYGRDGDYDGDGMADHTTVRLSSSLLTWVIKLSSGGTRSIQWGRTSLTQSSTLVYPGADFTGDGKDELVYQTASLTGSGANTWFIGDSTTGATVLILSNWGSFITDYMLQPDDYTGDGLADIVAMRSGGPAADGAIWYIRDTATGQMVPPVSFGISDPAFVLGDVPCRGNYDGDQRADVCVWRPSNSTFYWLKSSDGILGAQQWGVPSDTEFPLAIQWVF